MIKIVTLEYKKPHIFGYGYRNAEVGTVDCYKYFKSYIAENGKAIYVVDDKVVTKEEGNNIYKELTNKYKYRATIHTVDANDKEICEKLKNCIDPYYHYIDDTRQWEVVQKHNEDVYKILNAFEEVANS